MFNVVKFKNKEDIAISNYYVFSIFINYKFIILKKSPISLGYYLLSLHSL